MCPQSIQHRAQEEEEEEEEEEDNIIPRFIRMNTDIFSLPIR